MACFGLSIAVISYTISTHEVSHSKARLLATKCIFQNYSQLLDICTRLVLKTTEELILPSVVPAHVVMVQIPITYYTAYFHMGSKVVDTQCIVTMQLVIVLVTKNVDYIHCHSATKWLLMLSPFSHRATLWLLKEFCSVNGKTLKQGSCSWTFKFYEFSMIK